MKRVPHFTTTRYEFFTFTLSIYEITESPQITLLVDLTSASVNVNIYFQSQNISFNTENGSDLAQKLR